MGTYFYGVSGTFGPFTLPASGTNSVTGVVARLAAGPLATVAAAEPGGGLQVWPTPSRGQPVWVAGVGAGQAVQVFDMVGRLVKQATMPASGCLPGAQRPANPIPDAQNNRLIFRLLRSISSIAAAMASSGRRYTKYLAAGETEKVSQQNCLFYGWNRYISQQKPFALYRPHQLTASPCQMAQAASACRSSISKPLRVWAPAARPSSRKRVSRGL